MDKLKIKRIILIVLVGIISFIIRFQYKFPHHPDHFIWGEFTNTIIDYGYAPWILHPSSLFGYYPLSVPSGFEFFFSNLSVITGIELPILFFYSSIAIAFLGGLTVFILMRKWSSFETSFLASFALLTMSFYAKVTSNTASNRIFNIVLYPLFILLLFNISDSWKSNRKRFWKYVILSNILFWYMMLIHRFTQLSILFVISWFFAILFLHWKKILKRYQKTIFYKKRKKFYDKSELYIVLDLLIIFILLFGYKIIKFKILFLVLLILSLSYYFIFNFKKFKEIHLVFIDFLIYFGLLFITKGLDLLVRGRLLVHLNKYISLLPLGYLVVIIFVFLFLFIVVLGLFSKQIIKVFVFIEKYVKKLFIFIEKKPEKSISIGLLFLFLVSVSMTFINGGIFHIDNSNYKESFLISGDSSFVVFVNFLFNLNNNLTILVWFAFIGLVSLFFEKNKNEYHYFFIFVSIFFSQLIFDRQYVRLYLNPIYAIYIGIGLIFILKKIVNLRIKFRFIVSAFLILFISLHFIFSIAFMHRETMLDYLGIQDKREEIPEKYYIGAGEYLKGGEEFSILNSKQEVRYQRVSYYAHKPGAVSAQSIFTNDKNYSINRITFANILEDIRSGDKIRQFYTIDDTLMGRGYYHGKHIYRLTINKITDKYAKEIIGMYKIRYVIDSDIAKEKFPFFESIQPIKNKVYNNPRIDIYDLEGGRQ